MNPADSTITAARGKYSAAQNRTIKAAHELFGSHGVSGTSLKMIANALGVTKAAVYHQFKSKDDIVLAVVETELAGLADAIVAAEAEDNSLRAREILLSRVIDLAVERRRLVGVLQNDPIMIRFLAEHEPFQLLIERLYTVLAGEHAGADMRVPAAMLSAAIAGAAVHPLVVELDDDTLRKHLLHLTRRILQLPE
ncbi:MULTISPECIES: helix-turn-helix domain-containing protein [Nocardia]|uniref:TetR/AcrR family transcriptional regulator n=1 Tax=Nocardia vinacea TaxID=96468 RepID=A0ABZ1YQ18_9NOCA|nr:helix-turn-helix domain-containing protein [Nocardia vinacea]